jgi:hypothetical protein
MKKYISYVALFIACSFTLSACSHYLNEDPQDKISEDDAYSSISSLYLNGVASLYNYIGGNTDSQGLQGTGRGVYDLNTFTTDEAIMPTRGADWYDGGFWQGLYLHSWGVNNDAIQATWEYLYKVIMLCNKSIEKIDGYASTHSDSAIPSYKAEVRALRAMYYYYMMDLFGNVPIVTSSSVSVDEITQTGRKSVFDFIVKELQESVGLLSTEHSNQSGSYYGRITRPVAYFLLAKLALNAAIYTDDDWTDNSRPDGKNIYFTVGGNKMNAWQATEAYCDSIKALGYALESSYATNFAVYNEGSSENIFTIPMNKIQYSNQMQYLFRSRHYNHGKAYGLGGENGSSATLEALTTYGYGTNDVDPRFTMNYYADAVYDLNGNVVTLDNCTPLVYYPSKVALDVSGTAYEKTAGARMKKYAIDVNATKDGKLMENDIVLFRYADVLLMKSEAKIRNGEDGSAELNAVRDRVGATRRAATLDNILAERLLELAWEGWRRQDMVRFGLFTKAYSFRPQLSGESSGYTTVFPIPSKVLSTDVRLQQNPGYTK